MGSRAVDCSLILFDIGKNVSILEKSEKSFFERGRECLVRILERKIISRPTDLIGVVLIGSDKTDNELANQNPGSFTNIQVLFPLMQPEWDMIRNLPEKPTNKKGDWFEAMLVAADYYKNQLDCIKVNKNVIILMTNFEAPANLEGDIERVLKGFQNEFEVTVLGCNVDDNKTPDMQLAKEFIEITQGTCAEYEEAMSYLLFHRKKATKAMPWNVDLSIGPNIKIPVSVYGRIRDESIIKTWCKSIKDPVTGKSSNDVAFTNKREFINFETNKAIDPKETISGYFYGEKVIPLSENDKKMLYDSGEKCLSIYGFTSADNIKWHNLTGNGVSYLFGRKDVTKAHTAVKCLIECMMDLKLVAIARRVYNKGNAPAMHVLSPVVDQDLYCLSVIAISFKDDIKNMTFPPTELTKYSCTDEQVDAFKNLIHTMDLMKAYDDSYDEMEAFPTAETVNPSTQHILDCITFRNMNPGKPLPPPRDDLMELFKVPTPVEKRSKDALEDLKKELNLKKSVMLNRKMNDIKKGLMAPLINLNSNVYSSTHSSTDMPKVVLPKGNQDIDDIGTVDPVGDFKVLLNNGKNHADLIKEIIEVLEMVFMTFDNENNKNKILETFKFLREECVKNDPGIFNDWLKMFRKDLAEHQQDDVLNFLDINKLKIITSEENPSSSVANDEQVDIEMYECDTMPDSTQLSIQNDVRDYFDEM